MFIIKKCIFITILINFWTKSATFFNVIAFMISFHLSEQITDLEVEEKDVAKPTV